jgi:antitoxin MazE
MKQLIRLTRIGNSQGIRLKKELLRQYQIENDLEMETTPDGIILRPTGKASKLSWEETYREMAMEGEDWSEWDVVTDEGIPDEV